MIPPEQGDRNRDFPAGRGKFDSIYQEINHHFFQLLGIKVKGYILFFALKFQVQFVLLGQHLKRRRYAF